MEHNEFSKRTSYRRCILVLTLVWLVFICFGSWYPLNIRVMTLKEAVFQWAGSWSTRNAITDRVLNFALGIPTGLLLSAVICSATGIKRGYRRRSWILKAILWLLCCSLIAFAVEIGQVFFASRFSSLHDSLLQIAGSVLGGAAYVVLGNQIVPVYATTMSFLEQLGKASKTAIALIAIYFFVQFFPFIPGLSPSEIKYKLRQIPIDFSSGYSSFSDLDFSSLRLGLLYAFFSFLMCLLIGFNLKEIQKRSGCGKVLMIVVGISVITFAETFKIIIDSRFPSAINWIVSVLGFSFGLLLSVRYTD